MLRFYDLINPMWSCRVIMSSAVNLPNHTFTEQAKSSKRLTSIVHILLPETDNCSSWISERIIVEKYFLIKSPRKNVVHQGKGVGESNPHPDLRIQLSHRGWQFFTGSSAGLTLLKIICLRSGFTVNPVGSCRARSDYKTTLLLGRHSLLSG